jgi:hypothetical protein
MALLNYQQVNTPIGSVNPLEYSPLWPMGKHVRLVIRFHRSMLSGRTLKLTGIVFNRSRLV